MKRGLTPPLLLRAGLRYQWQHPWQAALALIGILMGVAVVLAVDLANQAAKASFALSAQQLRGGASHRLIAPGGALAQTLYRDLFTRPGSPPMAPVISASVRVDGQPGRYRLLGLDLFAEAGVQRQLPLRLHGASDLGDWLSRSDALGLSQSAADDLGLQPGDSLTLKHRGVAHRLRLFAVDADRSSASRDLLLVDIATAQAITGMAGHISHIDLRLDEAQRQWLEAHLPAGTRLLTIDEQTRGVLALSEAFELNLTAMSLLALLVGLFLIYNAIHFSIVQRRNLFGRLRALGLLPGEISRLILGEALVLAVLGTLLGTLLGIWIGQGLTRIVATTVSELYYQVSAEAMQVDLFSLAKAILLGLVGTLAAAWIPARQAASTPPLTTLSRAALEQASQRQLHRLGLLGSLAIGAGLITALALPGGVVLGFAGLFLLLLGAALVTPPLLHLGHRGLNRLPLAGIGRMAVRDLDRHLSRLGTAAAALMVALAASVGVAVMVESMRSTVADWLNDLLNADLYIAAEGFADGATLPDAVAPRLTGLPHLTQISSYRHSKLQLRDRRITLVAADLAPRSRQGFRLLRGSWQGFERGGLLLSEPLANRLGLEPGDRLQLPTPQGEVPFEVAAVFRDFASEHGRLFIDHRAYLAHWPEQPINTLALFAEPGQQAAMAAAARQRLADQALAFTAARAIFDESLAVFDRTFRITEVLRLLSLLVAFVGMLSALMALQLERRKEYAVLRALGLTRTQISGLILLESLILGLFAGLLALPTGLALAWILTEAIQLRAFGWTLPLQIAVEPLLLTLLMGLSAALLASLYPAWRSSWQAPAAQMRED